MRLLFFVLAIFIGLLGFVVSNPPTIGRRCFRGDCPALPPVDGLAPICYWSTDVVAAPDTQLTGPSFDATQNTYNDTTMSILAHVHLPAVQNGNETTFEEGILLNISSSNCQIIAMSVITPNFPSATNLDWLGVADLKTTHRGAIYCEAAPQCTIELRSALLTGIPLTESSVIIKSGEEFYMDYNYTALEICDGWKLQVDMKVHCNESTTDNSFCRFMFGTECPERILEDLTPSAIPASQTASSSATPSLPPTVFIPPDSPIIPGTGGIFNQHFPQIKIQHPNNRRVV